LEADRLTQVAAHDGLVELPLTTSVLLCTVSLANATLSAKGIKARLKTLGITDDMGSRHVNI